MKKNGKKTVFFCILHYFVLYMITQKAHLSLSSSKSDNCQKNQESPLATPLLSHFHTFTHFCMLNYLLKNFTPLLGKNTPFPIHFTPTFGHKNADFPLA